MRVLIADDQPHNRLILEEYLKPYGDCFFAETGREAVELFKMKRAAGNPFDLILLDIMMPVMNGQEALIKIRGLEDRERAETDGIDQTGGGGKNRSKRTIIIMVTSLDTPATILKSFYQGRCDGYLVKPVVESVLLAKLAEFSLVTPEQPFKNRFHG